LNRAVSQIDSTTQQNASTVEELASTSDNLSNEAKYLAETVERFKVSNSDGNAPHKIRQMHAAGFPFEEDMLTAPHATEDDNFEEF
jgi:hypothetical protein